LLQCAPQLKAAKNHKTLLWVTRLFKVVDVNAIEKLARSAGYNKQQDRSKIITDLLFKKCLS